MQTDDVPMQVTQSEFARRMKEMSALGGGYDFMGTMPEMYQVTVNTNHPLIVKIAAETDVEKQKTDLKYTIDLALLAKGLLKGEALTSFITRSLTHLN